MKRFKILKKVIDISLPVIGEMVVYNFMNIFDTMIVGYYGGNILVSSVGLSKEIIETFYGVIICLGLSTATCALVARSTGSKNNESKKAYGIIGIKLGIIISFIISIIFFYFNDNILKLFKASKSVSLNSRIYLKTISIILIPWGVINIINGIFRGLGNTVVPFKTSLIIAISKLLFDIIFVLGFILKPMGIFGVALATNISIFIGFTYIIYKSIKLYSINMFFELKGNFLKMLELIVIAIPCFLEEGVFGLSRLLCKSMIIKMGSVSFAVNEITNMIERISTMPSLGIGVAATALVGLNLGKNKIRQSNKYANGCVKFALGLMIFFASISFIIPEYIVSLFINKSETKVFFLTTACLRISAIEQPFIAISNVFSGALKGLGDAKTPFYISLFSSWCIRLPLMFIFINVLKYPISFVWWITSLQWILDGILMMLFFNRKIKHNMYKISRLM